MTDGKTNPQSDTSEFILRRARWELEHAQPYLAYRLFRDAATKQSGSEQRHSLESALDVCIEYFDKAAEETLETADRLCELGPNPRALVVSGAGRSIAARAVWASGDKVGARAMMTKAVEGIRKAIALTPFDTDAWGTLGGAYKRLSEWERSEGNELRAKDCAKKMLEAYEKGAENGPDPYPILNFLEYRAVFERNTQIVRSKEESERLERALYVRKRQFDKNENPPWAAFDIARGQHYLRPNLPRFLSDLDVAIGDARRAARRASDRWMVDTACKSLRDLFEAEVQMDGLEEALVLVRAAVVDDGWFAGNWGPLGRPEQYLAKELRDAQAQLAALAASSVETDARLAQFAARAESRWTQEDEERFAKELDEFKTEIATADKKQLRVLWKLFGGEAVKWGVTCILQGTFTAVAGPAGLVAGTAVSPYVAKYVAHLLGIDAE
jgi:hypothetical protein